MVERRLEEDDLLVKLELPYLQKIQAKSRAEGRREGEAEILLRLVEGRFGPLAEAVRTRVMTADAETLLRWSERLFSAASLDAVLAV